MARIRAVLLGSLLAAAPVMAQHWGFQGYGADAGLSNLNVLAIHQARGGFLWVSTEGGLFRFDGDRFQRFSVDSPTRQGYPLSLHTSTDGELWVGSPAGLFQWGAGAFHSVPGFEGIELEAEQSLASDSTRLYVANRFGLRAVNLLGGRSTLLSRRPVSAVFAAPGGTVWYGCAQALCSLRNGVERVWGPSDGVPPASWRAILQDPAGRLWARSLDSILVLDNPSGPFRKLDGPAGLISSRFIRLSLDRSGNVLAPHNNGLLSCSAARCRNFGPESGLRRSEVSDVLEDREGSLWIGYGGQGLARWLGRDQWQSFTELEGLADTSIWRIVRDAAGQLWVATNHGLFSGALRDGRWSFSRAQALGDVTIYGLVADPDGSLLVGTMKPTRAGLTRFYPASGRIVHHPPPPNSPAITVNFMDRDASGTVWIAAVEGVFRLPPGAAQIETVPLPVRLGTVDGIQVSGSTLYAATRRGLFIRTPTSSRLINKTGGLADDWVHSVTIAPDGAVWVAYFHFAGITRIDLSSHAPRFEHLTTANGLPSNVVYSQFFDSRGRHWVGTDSGVAVQSGGRWIPYDTSSGLVWNDCNANSFLAEPSGEVWIGTSAGLSHYRPAPARTPVLADTRITSILRNDLATQATVFDSSTYSIVLRYTVLSFLRPAPAFRYRLDASPWMLTTAREVRLAGLQSGAHHFEVQGESAPGVWGRPATFNFRIHPPWYLAWPTLTLASLLLAGLLWSVWRYREMRQVAIRQQLTLAVEARTAELAEATARAEQASRLKSEFLANMSHEIRTPLNGVIGLAQLALEGCTDPAIASHLQILQVSAEGLHSLINDVLDLSRIEAGRMEITPGPFNPRDLIGGTCLMFDHAASEKGLALSHHVAPEVPLCALSDENRLRQVLVNIIGNAIKFTTHGTVTVSCSCPQHGQLLFAIADTGIGIPADKQHLIFEAFRQADGSVSRHYGGSGLGLTISRKLVQAMGGQLSLESTPGSGSTFSFTVPAAPAAAPQAATGDDGGQAPIPPLKVLVAEDNKVNQYLISNLLWKLHSTPTIVENGRQAVATLGLDSFDLVLMDIQMPEMDGLEAVSRIRAAEQATGRHLPVIALTAHAMPGDRDSFIAAGMDDYLEKPIRVDRLNDVLRRFAPPNPAP